MNDSSSLAARDRTGRGKGAARRIRREGACPAILYGPGIESRLLEFNPRDLQKLIQAVGENSLIELAIAGRGGGEAEREKVIIRDIQYRPLDQIPHHVDFYKVSLDRAITISVSIEVVGTCLAVENKTGVVSLHAHEVNIECLPTLIPSKLKADISNLNVGGSLHARDLALPQGVTLADSLDTAIVSINAVKEEVEEEEVAPELESAEPEVIGQEKPGEEASD